MIKKKAKKAQGKAGTKRRARRKGASKSKRELNPAEVRKDIAKIVEESAVAMAEAVVEEAMKGQLAPTKYLWEVAGVYPLANDGSTSTTEEDSLAKTLLDRLNLPTEPIKLDDEDEAATVVIPAKKALPEGEETAAAAGGESENL